MPRFHLFAAIAVLPLGACTGEEDPAEHACEHIDEAGTAIDAVDAMEDVGEDNEMEVDDEPYTVSLVDSAAGFVGIHVHEDTEAILWADTADVVAAIYHDGDEETLPTPGPSEVCPDDIVEHFELDLHEGEWTLEVGPAAVDSVWLMLTGAEGHGHEHE